METPYPRLLSSRSRVSKARLRIEEAKFKDGEFRQRIFAEEEGSGQGGEAQRDKDGSGNSKQEERLQRRSIPKQEFDEEEDAVEEEEDDGLEEEDLKLLEEMNRYVRIPALSLRLMMEKDGEKGGETAGGGGQSSDTG